MGLISDWRASRERRQRAERYLQLILTVTDRADVDWLASACGDRASAERELRFLRRAVALIVAERDALDDRTASDVSHALIAGDAGSAREADAAEWAARFRAYTSALAVRGQTDAPAARLAKVLLDGAGAGEVSAEQAERATEIVQGVRNKANEVLRTVFGVASLPEDVRPSALRS